MTQVDGDQPKVRKPKPTKKKRTPEEQKRASELGRALAAMRVNPGKKPVVPCIGPCTAKRRCSVCRHRELDARLQREKRAALRREKGSK